MKTPLVTRYWAIGLGVAMMVGLTRDANAQATLNLVLTPTPISTTPGKTLSFLATLTNGTGSVVDLLGSSGGVLGPSSLFWDDTIFLDSLPFSLGINGQYQNTLFLPTLSTTQAGLYTATYIVDGQIGNTPISATGNAQITVAAAGVTAPEPGTLPLLLVPASLACVGVARLRRRNRAERQK